MTRCDCPDNRNGFLIASYSGTRRYVDIATLNYESCAPENRVSGMPPSTTKPPQ